MNLSKTNMELRSYLESLKNKSLDIVNHELEKDSGIINFFDPADDRNKIFESYQISDEDNISMPERPGFCDFQTNSRLSDSICNIIFKKKIDPEIIIEPTCGKGGFIISALKCFKNISTVYGIEIHKQHLWLTKFSVLQHFLCHPEQKKPKINLIYSDIFKYDFSEVVKACKDNTFLILGNPPWVTNSQLSVIESSNLPKKINYKNHNGIDSITGKGNFDIGENIAHKLLTLFSNYKGYFSFILKNSVIKNIIHAQKSSDFLISSIEQYAIDAKSEFNAAVDASVMFCRFGMKNEFTVDVYDIYEMEKRNSYGWADSKFVSDILKYVSFSKYDGLSPFEWRQGIKHDCSKVMELEKVNGFYKNGFEKEYELESNLIYPLFKSSDIANGNEPRKSVIITQSKIGQDTSYYKKTIS